MGSTANDVEDEHRRGAKSPWAAEVDGFIEAAKNIGARESREALKRAIEERYTAPT